MLSEDHSVFRNTESKILGFSMILEHPLNAAFSNIRTHFIMTNSDTVGIFLYVISRMTFPIYFSKAFGSCGVFQ
jgi:citrate lyase synthetase